ncbi:unnamed protein product [Prunus armeniaca]
MGAQCDREIGIGLGRNWRRKPWVAAMEEVGGCGGRGELLRRRRVVDEFLNLPSLLTKNLTKFDGRTNGATQHLIE